MIRVFVIAMSVQATAVLLVLAALRVVQAWSWACTLIVVFVALLVACEFVAGRWEARTRRARGGLAGPAGRKRVGL